MLASWSRPFSAGKNAAHCQLLELSIVESVVRPVELHGIYIFASLGTDLNA